MGLAQTLKKKLILSYLESKKTKEPFDLDAAEGFQLPADAGINVNNSHFFTASNESGETLSIRLGMRNGSDYEIFVLYRNADCFLVHEKDSYAPSECPVKFTQIEAGKRWRTDFKGRLRDTATGEIKESEISVEFEATLPIYDFLYHADRFNGMADAIAREKWNKTFFAEIGKNNQRHYEQTGKMVGKVIFGEETFALDLPCVRDHSFGIREWDLMNDHIWCCCQNDKGEALCISVVNYPSMKRLFSGYTNIGFTENRTLRDYELIEYDPADGLGGDVLRITGFFPEFGKGGAEKLIPMEIEIRRTDNIKCVFGGGKYIFQESLADFTITPENGAPVKARGTLEYGFNTDPNRWEGYSKL